MIRLTQNLAIALQRMTRPMPARQLEQAAARYTDTLPAVVYATAAGCSYSWMLPKIELAWTIGLRRYNHFVWDIHVTTLINPGESIPAGYIRPTQFLLRFLGAHKHQVFVAE